MMVKTEGRTHTDNREAHNRKRLLTGIYGDGKVQVITLLQIATNIAFRIKIAEERLVHLVIVSKCACCCAMFNIFITEIL